MNSYYLSSIQDDVYRATLKRFDDNNIVFRIWAKDSAIFSGADEGKWLDWLQEPELIRASLPQLRARAEALQARGFTSIVLLGMGGSSVSPIMFKEILAPSENFFVLDTTHPDAIFKLTQQIKLEKTLFIVASKSGSTLEPLVLYRHFYEALVAAHVDDPFSHFIAITDPVTYLEKEASEHGFLPGAFGKSGIGGRFSGLSVFGIMPALLMNIDVQRLLDATVAMVHESGPTISAKEIEGLRLAAFLLMGLSEQRYQLAIHLDDRLIAVGYWLEQLIAESLGKHNFGIVPLVGTHRVSHRDDTMNLFIGLNHDELKNNAAQKQPSFCIHLDDLHDLGSLMFSCQLAIACVGAGLKINPFDQPDVENSKKHTREILANMSANPLQTTRIKKSLPPISQEIAKIKPGDFGALLCFIDESPRHHQLLIQLKDSFEEKTSVPFLIQYGPRYLHSTGQLFKGGYNRGHFFVITGPYHHDYVSNHNELMFSMIHFGQALGDIAALQEAHRHVVHYHFTDIEHDIATLAKQIADNKE